MSATVTYKGATLTTATNQTRTLDTAGTYLEDDITITDVTTIPTGTKNISITSNGTTTEDVTSYASASITANVPNSYTASDEGKVVSNGSLVSQTSATYTANDTYDTTTINSVTVNVQGGGGYTIDDIASTEPSGAITLTTPTVRAYAFYNNSLITSVTTNGTTRLNDNAFRYCTNLTTADLTGVTTFDGSMNMANCSKLTTLIIPDLVTITNQAFNNCKLTGVLKLKNLTSGQGNNSFGSNTRLTKVYFFKKFSLSYQQNLLSGCTGITDIYVPWSSGEVSGAPWGASNATVHYNTTYDANDEPI